MKPVYYHEPYSELETQVLIDLFNVHQIDSKTARIASRKIDRNPRSIQRQLSRLREMNLIGESKYSARAKKIVATKNAKKAAARQTVRPVVERAIVNEQKNDELTLIKLIISKLGTEQKLELIKSMLV